MHSSQFFAPFSALYILHRYSETLDLIIKDVENNFLDIFSSQKFSLNPTLLQINEIQNFFNPKITDQLFDINFLNLMVFQQFRANFRTFDPSLGITCRTLLEGAMFFSRALLRASARIPDLSIIVAMFAAKDTITN